MVEPLVMFMSLNLMQHKLNLRNTKYVPYALFSFVHKFQTFLQPITLTNSSAMVDYYDSIHE